MVSLRNTLTDFTDTVGAFRAMIGAGMIPFPRIDHAARMVKGVRTIGPAAAAINTHALNGVDRVALIDERGPLSYAEVDQLSNALVRGWQADGLDETTVIGAICRNHRGFLLLLVAAGKLGAKLVLMNTGFAAPQLVAVTAREKVNGFVYDSEFSFLADALPDDMKKYVSWKDPGDHYSGRPFEDMIAGQSTDAVPKPSTFGGLTLLTSGTTGPPKGAPRDKVSPLAAAQILDRVPLSTEQTLLAAAPLFHGTGLGMLLIALGLRNTVVMARYFDPAKTVQLLADHRCDSLVVVPTMLQRITDLGPDVIGTYDTSNLKVIFSSGAALSPDVCRKTADYLGDVLYNMYGSTEVAVATVATPTDLKRAPGTAGIPPVTCRVALYDNENRKITEHGRVGRIFAGNATSFNGYTDGRDKERIDGLLSTGDVGHFDNSGMLFVEGRDDDMIVSGGENVYPNEIENLLADRTDVLDVCVVGVQDDEFGQRLRAFVVPATDSKRDVQEIKDHVKANLARYKVPRDVVFIDELPRNATGKLLRRALVDREV